MPTKKKTSPLLKMLMQGKLEEVSSLFEEHPSQLLKLLTDKGIPVEQRVKLLSTTMTHDSDFGSELLTALLSMACSNETSELKELKNKTDRLQEMLKAMEAGPLRTGRFVRMLKQNGSPARALVTLHDGSQAASPVPDSNLAERLRCGDGVLLEAQGRAVLYGDRRLPETGETATLERRINEQQVLVTLNHDERRVLHASASLLAKLQTDGVDPGTTLLVSSQESFAFDVVAADDELSHYRYLDRTPAPQRVEMGCPPQYIGTCIKHAEIAMRQPELLRKWKLPLSRFVLLEGVTGSGKSLSIDLLQQRMTELTATTANVPIEQVPPFVFRVRPSDIFEKWLGSSDRNLARVFSEVEQLGMKPFETADGLVIRRRPIIVVIEEFEGIARARGGQNDAVYDRIMVTLLQLMDPARAAVAQNLVFWICTTNLIREVDAAAIRRAGGIIEKFSHLSRPTFQAVLYAQLNGLALAPCDGLKNQSELQRRVTTQLANWLYCPNGEDPGQVELIYANSEPETKYRRHFLTGAVVARGVQQATSENCTEEYDGAKSVGLTARRLMDAIDQQIRAMAGQLSPQNVTSFIRIKEGGHVSDVRRITQPTMLPHHLRRAS